MVGCPNCTFADTNYLPGTCGPNFQTFMTLVSTLFMSQTTISDPCSRLGRDPDLYDGFQTEYDFIVVGAGVAGPIVMARLSENPSWTVLGIEAGPEEPTLTMVPGFNGAALSTPLDWAYRSEKEKKACLNYGGHCYYPRGKMVSGSSGLSGSAYIRGNYKIFDEWGKYNPGWNSTDMLSYFKKSETNLNPELIEKDVHGFEGPLPVQNYAEHPPLADDILRAAEECGFKTGDLNGKNQKVFNIAQMMVKDGLRASTPRMYLRPAKDRPNLYLAINSLATKILINETTETAFGVEFQTSSGEIRRVFATKEVIVSAGVMGSPKLLMLSGIGPKKHLEELKIPVVKDLPVGQNFLNHVNIRMNFTINQTVTNTLSIQNIMQFIGHRKGYLSSIGLTQVTGFAESKYSTKGIPDLQLFFEGMLTLCSETGNSKECPDGKIGNCPMEEIHAFPTVVMPKSKGFLKLRDRNPTSPPQLYPNYFADEDDIKALLEGIKIIIKISKTKALQKYNMTLLKKDVAGCDKSKDEEYWKCVIMRDTGPEHHQGGTCKMGPEDQHGVVDNLLRVYGINNLRVIDSSVYPTLPNSNLIASVVAIGEKGAEIVDDEWDEPEEITD